MRLYRGAQRLLAFEQQMLQELGDEAEGELAGRLEIGGSTGPGGLTEKDLVLDVAQRLGRLIEERLESEVIYTRSDDTFIPLESRTEMANEVKADLFLSVGTSLQVYPIAGAVPAAKNAGARVVIVNAEATPFDGIADAVLRGAIGETLPRMVGTADLNALDAGALRAPNAHPYG